jgi:hypothetical protein
MIDPSPCGSDARLETFASAETAAKHLSIKRREVLAMARRGVKGAYPLDPKRKRKTWIFRLSELTMAITQGDTIASCSPAKKGRSKK